jgi:hypothetical protein
MPAYSRMDPRYRRFYVVQELRRKGYRKAHEKELRHNNRWIKVLVYRRRTWSKSITHDHLVEIWPDGSMKSSHSVYPRLVGI